MPRELQLVMESFRIIEGESEGCEIQRRRSPMHIELLDYGAIRGDSEVVGRLLDAGC